MKTTEREKPPRTGSSGSDPPWNGLRLWHFGLPALVVLLLGIHGFWMCKGRPEEPLPILDLIYLSLQLFVLESGMQCEKAPILTLQIARFAAPIVPAGALLWAILQTLRHQMRGRRLRALREHTVIVGLGSKGVQLARDFRAAGEPVVAVDLDGDNDNIRRCSDLGAFVLIGNAVDEIVLRRARVPLARRLVAISGDDGLNVEIAMLAHRLAREAKRRRGGNLTAYVHVVDPRLCGLFKSHHVFADRDDRFQVRVFNVPESNARFLLESQPLDWVRIAASDPRTVHLVCIGFGRTGEAVLLQAARVCHLANGRPLRATVIDLDAAAKERAFRGHYPLFDRVCEVAFLTGDAAAAESIARIAGIAGDESCLPTLVVCMNDDSRNLMLALQMRDICGARRVPICVRMVDVAGLATLASSPASEAAVGPRVIPFGMASRVCTRRMLEDPRQDQLARAIQRRAGDPVDWQQLDAMAQEAYRQQADHIPVKLRAVGRIVCPAASTGDPAAPLTAAEVEIMARMEQARRGAASALAAGSRGFRAGWPDGREEPGADERDLIRAHVRAIPDLLAAAGLRAARDGQDGRATPQS